MRVETKRTHMGYAVAVMRRSTIIGHVPQEDISCLLAISGTIVL